MNELHQLKPAPIGPPRPPPRAVKPPRTPIVIPWRALFIGAAALLLLVLVLLVVWPGRYVLQSYPDGVVRIDRFTGQAEYWSNADRWRDGSWKEILP